MRAVAIKLVLNVQACQSYKSFSSNKIAQSITFRITCKKLKNKLHEKSEEILDPQIKNIV